jgi:maleylacetoacetate isomerase
LEFCRHPPFVNKDKEKDLMQLYDFWRSSAAYRVRIALNLKNLPYESIPVHLGKGEQSKPEYKEKNPQGFVPLLIDGPRSFSQSLAICEYLDETHPAPPFLPATPEARARVRSIALTVACDIHPLNNKRILDYLRSPLGHDDATVDTWYRHWVAEGLEAIEKILVNSNHTGKFCHGDQPSLADICLVPQTANAIRFECPLEPYPTIQRIYVACLALPAFDRAQPANQRDAQ